MDNDPDSDESMRRFEDLGRKLFQQKPKPDEAEITDDDDDSMPQDED